MMSTSRAVTTSPACAAARRRQQQHQQQHDRWWSAPGRTGAATLFVAKQARRGRWGDRGGAAPCSVRADTIGCLEAAEPWGAVAPPALALPGLQVAVAAPAPGDDALAVPSEQRVREVVLKQAALTAAAPRTARIEPEPMAGGLKAAFDRCGEVCKEYAKTFYLADDAGEEEGHLGDIRVVQEDGRARRRAQRVPHLGRGAGPLGVEAGGHLRRPALRHAGRRPLRHRRQLPRRHPAVQGHDRGDAHGPEQVPVPDLRRAVPLLLLRRRHRGAHERPGDGDLAGIQGGHRDGLQWGAGPRPGEPAHQHPQGRRRGCEEGKDLPPTGRAGDGGALGSRHLQRPRHRRVERLHAGPDHEGASLLQAGRGRRHRAQSGEPMAGVGFSASVPADPGRDRGQRLRQLHQEGLRSQDEEADGAAQGLPQITDASLFSYTEPKTLLQPNIEGVGLSRMLHWYLAVAGVQISGQDA